MHSAEAGYYRPVLSIRDSSSLTQSLSSGLTVKNSKGELKKFGAVCRVVKNLRNLTVAAVGARVFGIQDHAL